MNNSFEQLIAWYRQNKRDLPWRNTREPYKIWISEIMLQQTRVTQVIDYFMTFLRYFPEINDLANADEKQLLKVWQGLGYYSRALNMKHTANEVMTKYNGEFPANLEQIRSLKGIGEYTAAAIGSIAFGLKSAAVDGNVKRVAARFYGISEPVDNSAVYAQISRLLNIEILEFDASDFNQAMIELGALICLPRNPNCLNCPIQMGCVAFNANLQHVIPVKLTKKAPRTRYIDFLFLSWKGKTWIAKRNYDSIWKGLYEFPNIELLQQNENNNPVDVFKVYLDNPAKTTVLGCFEAKHQLTHQTIFARFWHLSGKESNIVKENIEFIQIPIEKIFQYPVHRLMHKYLVYAGLDDKKKLNNNDK